eukprot:SAG31_NODE_1238_length_9176_cov_9.589181_3_plen_98_part_00
MKLHAIGAWSVQLEEWLGPKRSLRLPLSPVVGEAIQISASATGKTRNSIHCEPHMNRCLAAKYEHLRSCTSAHRAIINNGGGSRKRVSAATGLGRRA